MTLVSDATVADAVFFWNADEPSGFMSQWLEHRFTVDGQDYLTNEHWMMASKARLFQDVESERRILAAGTPEEARDLGRLVANFDRKAWDKHKYEIVLEGNRHKFNSSATLRAQLLQTGSRLLVEASPVDRIWGVGFDRTTAAANTNHWGENL
ncbi:hypothetical protein PYCC9005_000334 [Savitreella phatthalungensis]